mgnify:CR=1 FL=1
MNLKKILSIFSIVLVGVLSGSSLVFAQNVTVSQDVTIYLSDIGRSFTLSSATNALDQLAVTGTTFAITTNLSTGTVVVRSTEGLNIGGANNSLGLALTSCNSAGSVLTIQATATAAVVVTVTPPTTGTLICSPPQTPVTSTGTGDTRPGSPPNPTPTPTPTPEPEDESDLEPVAPDDEETDLPVPSSTPVDSIFRDIPAVHWAANAVVVMYERSIMRGQAEGVFNGPAPTVRAEMVAIILRLLGQAPSESDQPTLSFADVELDQWYAVYFNKAKDGGIIIANEDNNARPKDFVTRAEIVTMLARAGGVDLSKINLDNVPFTDFDKGKWWASGIAWGYQNGILKGYSDNSVQPNGTATRFEIAVMVARYLDVVAASQ